MRLVRSPRLRACHLRRGLFRACALGLCLIAAPAVHASFWIDDEEVGPPPTLEQRRAAEPAEAPVAKAGGWLQWHDARYRLSSSGDLVCQSDNGIDCGDFSTAGRVAAWSLRVWPVTAFSALRQVEPVLTCGAPHARIWRGNDGYQQPDHWCTLGRDIGVLQSPFLRALRDAQRKSP